MLLFNPANSSFFILLYAIFVSGTFMIYKNFRSNKKKDFNIKNMHNKYKIEKVIVMGLIVFFYIIDIPTIIVFSFFLIEEIRELNVPNALPSSLNIGIESMVLYWIICIIPFIVITVLIVKNNKKSVSEGYCRYAESSYLSYMLKDYYTHRTNTRFTNFVSNMGGKEELLKMVTDYTRGHGIVKHHILSSSANDAANNAKINKRYHDSYITTEVDGEVDSPVIGVYALEHPSIVTSEESNALKYAFERVIQDGVNSESNN